jgi:hypothetical protein
MTTTFTFTLSSLAAARASVPVELTPWRDEVFPSLSPSWLWERTWGNRWLGVMADEKDLLMQLSIDSVNCRYPSLAPNDALPLLAYQYNLTRGFQETDADYRVRLQHAWSHWQWSGTDLGILIAMQPSGFTTIPWDPDNPVPFNPNDPAISRVFVVRNCDTGIGCPDGNFAFWNRFWVCIDASDEAILGDGVWGSPGTYGDGGVWGAGTIHGSLITGSMIGSWIAAIRQFKPAGWTCVSIEIGEYGASYPIGDPTGTISIHVGE